MTNIWAWFDPTQGVTTVSGDVSQWVDTAFGVTVSQATSANRPTFSSTAVNGFPGLTMTNAVAHSLLSSTTNSIATLSLITIMSCTTSSSTASTIISGNATSVIDIRLNNHQMEILKQQFASVASETSTVTDGALNIFAVTISNAGAYSFRLNGTADNSGTSGTNTFASATFGLFQNFSVGGTNETFNGSIGDIIITSAVSSTSDLQKAEGYLAWKYSMTSLLPSGHPYKSVAP